MRAESVLPWLKITIATVVVGGLAAAPALGQVAETTFGPAASGNAHRVDGKHAVGAGASRTARKGKLVATSTAGYLPNNIIKKANNADRLDGFDSSAFAKQANFAALLNLLGANIGAVNQSNNPVHWKQIKGVPGDIADGDAVGYNDLLFGSVSLGAGASTTIVWGFHKNIHPVFNIIPLATGYWFEITRHTYSRQAGGIVNHQITVKNLKPSAGSFNLRATYFNVDLTPAGAASALAPARNSSKIAIPKIKRSAR